MTSPVHMNTSLAEMLDCDEPNSVQYLLVQQNSSIVWELAEVSVYGMLIKQGLAYNTKTKILAR